jgi:hypothetical protein
MIDLKLNTVHDLDIGTDLNLIGDVNGSDQLAYYQQKVKIVLLFFFAEWFLDVTIGIKYLQSIFVKNPNLTLIDSLFKIAITEIEGIVELIEYDSTFSIPNRSIEVEFVADTDAGELTLTQEITI